MMTKMSDVYLVPQKSTFEIQDFTYVYVVDKEGIVKVRSFQPLQRYEKFYITEDLEPDTYIVYEGIQSVKDGMEIHPDTISFQQIIQGITLDKDSLNQ